jgi:hypothetical protein
MKYFKINTAKKRFAFEIIILTIVLLFAGGLILIRNYSEEKYNTNIYITRKDSLNENYFNIIYILTKNHFTLEGFSYEAFKKNILDDKDSSFRKKVYYACCSREKTFSNDVSFVEFINNFEYDSINSIESEISLLKQKIGEIYEQRQESNEFYNNLIKFILITAYPIRFLYYLIRWALRTLEISKRKKDIIITPENIVTPDNDKIIKKSFHYTDPINTLHNDITAPSNNPDNETNIIETVYKGPLPIWIRFSKEYISGSTYLWRMIIGTFLILFLGLGLYFMVITAYKRSNSLGLNKNNSILVSIIVTLLILICSVMRATVLSIDNYLNNTDQYYQFLALTFLLLIPHFILIFKNGNTESIKSGAKI